jgi:hypothetical protein
MSSPYNEVIGGRLIIFPFAPLCPLIVLLCTGVLKRHRTNLWIRGFSTILSAILYLGVVGAQLLLFRMVSRVQHATSDGVVFSTLLLENLISLGILFYRLAR